MSLIAKKAFAAAQQDNLQHPPTHSISRATHYDVNVGSAPTFVPFSGTTSRLAVQFNAGGPGIGTSPYKIIIPYRRIGNPTANISVGIRKAAGDTFQLLGQWPTDGYTKATPIITITIDKGFKADVSTMYQMLASDKISVEYPPDNTNSIEVAMGTGLPAGFTSQQYTGSYAATAQPLALKITSRILTPI